jgi:site-specific DNA-cytosine methylase
MRLAVQRWGVAGSRPDDGRGPAFIAGGFPCKGASNAGPRTGLDHPETALWAEFARIVGELRPRYVAVENVAAIRSIHSGAVWGTVLGDLAALGYDVAWGCVRASDVGAPHGRDRIFAVARHADADGGDGRSDGQPEHPEQDRERYVVDDPSLPTLLPTPHGMAKEGQARRPGPTGNELGRALTLLPTPASLHNREDPAQFEARRARLKAKGINGNGAGTPLAIAVKLLPTPTANMEHRRDPSGRRPRSDTKGRRTAGALGSLSSGASTSPPSDDGKRSTDPRPRLSPEFVGWMMGEPRCNECGRGWTDSDCQHSATAYTSTSAGSSGTRS